MAGKIAPHKNREVQLVLAGVKPLAAIERDKSPHQYNLAIALGQCGMLTTFCLNKKLRNCNLGEVIITKPCRQFLIIEYLELLQKGPRDDSHGYHVAMGQLFGYTVADIELFLKTELNCQCKKCRGAG